MNKKLDRSGLISGTAFVQLRDFRDSLQRIPAEQIPVPFRSLIPGWHQRRQVVQSGSRAERTHGKRVQLKQAVFKISFPCLRNPFVMRWPPSGGFCGQGKTASRVCRAYDRASGREDFDMAAMAASRAGETTEARSICPLACAMSHSSDFAVWSNTAANFRFWQHRHDFAHNRHACCQRRAEAPQLP